MTQSEPLLIDPGEDNARHEDTSGEEKTIAGNTIVMSAPVYYFSTPVITIPCINWR
jgi:hypothetical protein